MVWAAAVFIAAVGVAVYVRRRELAHAEALVMGGSILPGCVVVQAIVLIAVAIAMIVAHLQDLI